MKCPSYFPSGRARRESGGPAASLRCRSLRTASLPDPVRRQGSAYPGLGSSRTPGMPAGAAANGHKAPVGTAALPPGAHDVGWARRTA